MVTRKDIAREVGVSVSVVSRALNNSGYVDAGKRKKIIEKAEELGYVPNPKAMSLMQNRTRQILFYSKNLKKCLQYGTVRGYVQGGGRTGLHCSYLRFFEFL